MERRSGIWLVIRKIKQIMPPGYALAKEFSRNQLDEQKRLCEIKIMQLYRSNTF